MDVGQSTANGLYQQAVAGSFQMEEGAARRCAEIFQRFAESLDEFLPQANDLKVLQGFGGFVSATHLQHGFEDKGAKLVEAISGMQEAALRMAAAYLQAGKLVDEAESINALAVKTVEANQQ